MRRGARRLPQLSQRNNGAVGSMTPAGAIVGTVTANMVGLPQDSNGPTSYWSSYSEIWELLRRVWALEHGGPNTGGPGGGGMPGYNYVIACTFNGVFADDQVFIRHPVQVPIAFPDSFSNSAAVLDVSTLATSSYAIDISQSSDDGVVYSSIGTITFATNAKRATWSSAVAGVTAVPAGNILLFQGAATADATAGNIGITAMAKMTL